MGWYYSGYWETIVYLQPNDTFSLVGARPPPAGTPGAGERARESSSVYPEISAGQRPTGELHGVLARSGRGNWYSPLNADPSGYANVGLYEVLATPSATFPSVDATAFQYINNNLCIVNTGVNPCTIQNYNIRDLYGDLSLSLVNSQNALQAMMDASGRSCGTADADANFCAARAQLLQEFVYVNNILDFYKNVNGLWQSSGTITIDGQLSAYNTIKAQLQPPEAAPSQSLVSPLVNFFLGLASLLPEVGTVFGLADVAFNFGTSLTTDSQGNKTIDLTSTIGELQAQAIAQFTAQATTTGTLFQLMLQDWGKLSALGMALGSAHDPSSPWFWSTTATGQILNQMATAIQQAAYQNIMAAAYAIGSYFPDSGTAQGWGWGQLPLSAQPYAYVVIENRNAPSLPVAHPFYVPPYFPYTYPNDPGNEWANDPRTTTLMTAGQWLGISQLNTPVTGPSDDFRYQPPSEDLARLLFNPAWMQGNLGVYRPAFFNSWPFPRVACTPSYGDRNGYLYPGGCNWSAAAPAPETVGASPLSSVTTRATHNSRPQPRQPQVDVILSVHNNGTATAHSVTIDSIKLRTLAGSGKVTLISTPAPMQLSNVRPGEATHVPVRLIVPPGVLRFSITLQGTLTTGNLREPVVSRFSEEHALFLESRR